VLLAVVLLLLGGVRKYRKAKTFRDVAV